MKKITLNYVLLLSTAVLGWTVSVANAQTVITVNELDNPKSSESCTPSETTNYSYYLEDDGYYTHPADDFWVRGFDALILNSKNGSSIDIWRGKKNDQVLTKCNTWWRMSNIVKDGDKVVAFANPAGYDDCVFNIPTYSKENNPEAIDAQIHFAIGYRKVRNGGPNTFPSDQILFYKYRNESNYRCYPNGNSVSDANTCTRTNVRYGSDLKHVGECQNYRIFWCGDGLVNGINGTTSYDNGTYKEECDPEASAWKNRTDGQKCNTSCKIEYEAPICSSDYNGKSVYQSSSTPYLNGTEKLCNIGSVKNFLKSGTPILFTWGCENGSKFTDSKACSLNQYWCGDGLVNQPDGRWDNYINGSHYEACDPTASEWKNKTNGEKCNNSCGFDKATCGSKKGTTEYNSNFPTGRITASSEGLCGLGKLVEGSFSGPDENGKYKWKCINGTKESDICEAQDLRCGDGKKNGTEVCDPKDPNHENWGDGCSATCEKTYGDAVCGSAYNGQTKYQDISNEWLNKNTSGLCDKGEAVEFSLDKTTGKYTWKCKNGSKTSDVCTAQQLWCGDGKKNGTEVCDPKDPNHENWGDGCSATCEKTYGDAVCGSAYNGQTKYQDISNEWLNKNTSGLCDKGEVINFSLNRTTGKYEWQCKNGTKVSGSCTAQQLWCGDGKKNGSEACDPKDPNEEGWGSDGCSMACEKVDYIPNDCDAEFEYTLRQGHDYIFWDVFHAKDADRRLYGDPVVTFLEQKDYNRGQNPTFKWTNWDPEKKVSKNNSIKVVESSPEYHIYDHPDVRSKNNLYIEYALQYANRSSAPESRWKTHKECVHYDISRCGDGILDTDWEGKRADEESEICDPKDPNKTNWGNGGCDESCKPVTKQEGKLKIEKTLKDKKTVEKVGEELTWQVKVVADGGDVTDFEVKDLLPTILDYVSYSVVSNPDNLTLTGPTGPVKSGSNNVYTWDVTGTLKSGGSHELIIEVKTKVNTMPKSTDDFRNVACVIKGNDEDCDDAKPGTWDIKKTLLSPKEITKTGDSVVWSLKLTVDGGEVKNPLIKDILPPVLGYKDYIVVHNPGVEISAPVKTTVTYSGQTLEQIEWKTNGTLKDNDYIEIQLTTYVKSMPDKKYDNVLCVDPENEDEKCDDEPLHNPLLRIKKFFSDGTKEKTVKVGETIEYKVLFGNKGTAPATITSIKDFLPKNVKYISSEIFVDGEKVHTNDTQSGETSLFNGFKVVDGVYIDIYGGITLNPGVEGYILIKGEVLSDNQTSTQNWACIYLNDKKPDDSIIDGNPCDDAIHHLGGLICSKEDFKIETTSFTNAGGSTSVSCGTSPKGEKASTILIDCGNGTTYTGADIASLSGTCTYPANTSSSSVSYNIQCKVNNVDSSDCKGTVTVPGQSSPCFPAGTKVIMADGTKKDIDKVEVGDYVLSYNTITNKNEGNLVMKKLVHEDSIHEMYELTMNGEVLKVTGVHKFYVRENKNSSKYGWIEAKNLKVGNILLMSDGRLTEIEKINHYPNQETVYNFEVENNHNYFVAEGYLVHNSKGKDDPYCKAPVLEGSVFTCTSTDKVYAIGIDCDHVDGKADIDKEQTGKDGNREVLSVSASCSTSNKVQCYVKKNSSYDWETLPSTCGWNPTTPGGGGGSCCSKKGGNGDVIYDCATCFNVNAGNASIEDSEILPVYRNVRKLAEAVENGHYEEYNLSSYPYGEKSNFDNMKGDSCKTDGNIALNSMMCEFAIKDSELNVVKSWTVPCLSNKAPDNLVNAWIIWQRENYKDLDSYDIMDGTSYTFKSNVQFINFKDLKDAKKINNYGEYSISLEKIDALWCADGKWEVAKPYESVCQSNFVLTNPYSVQKTPSGNFTKTSTEKLRDYLYSDGTAVMSNLLTSSIIDTSVYQENDKVKDAMNKFINKYEKLAVTVSTDKFGKDGSLKVKKVPGKDIYFLQGNARFQQSSKTIDKAFTIVQTEGNTIIDGDLKYNMMLLTRGEIVFNDSSSCNHRQQVKGIFYTEKGFNRNMVQKNDNLKNGTRCTEGGLTIRGVAIGKGIGDIMKNSRSNLNGWFEAKNKDGEGSSDNKKNVIMNGASVLIEYSPSVFTKATMPPGAEEFTTALSIYKN